MKRKNKNSKRTKYKTAGRVDYSKGGRVGYARGDMVQGVEDEKNDRFSIDRTGDESVNTVSNV